VLSKLQIKQLKAKAHLLKPVVMVGQNGLTDNVHHEIDSALEAHELIKIKIPALDAVEKKALLEKILTQHQAEKVMLIGRTLVIFRARKTEK
jgi:RNA-binding protein